QGISHPDMELRELVHQWQEVRWILQRFADGGEYDGLFDGTEEDFDAHPIQTFELHDLLQRARLLGPVLRYVLPQGELQMSTDRPMLLLSGPAAFSLADPQARKPTIHSIRRQSKKDDTPSDPTAMLCQTSGHHP